MKKLFYIFILLSVFFLYECKHAKEFDPLLSAMEELITNHPDSALIKLENLYPSEDFDKYNQAYYYILLTEARHKNGKSLLDSDTLLDIALNYFMKNNYPDLLGRAYLWKGRVWKELDKPEQATHIYLKGIEILEKNKVDSEILSKLYDDLGNIYRQQSLYEEALNIFRKEYEMDKVKGESRGLAFPLRNIGSTYDFMGKTDSVLSYYEEALKYAGLSEDSVYLSDVINNDISIFYNRDEKFDKALLYLKKIVNPTENMELNKASLFIRFNQLDSASHLLNSTIASNDIFINASGNLYYSRIESTKGNYKAAYNYYKTFKIQSDSIYRQRKTAELKAIDHLYNIEKETTKLKNQYKVRIGALILVAIITFTVIGVFSIFKNKKRELADMEREKYLFTKEKEIDELHNQLLQLETEIKNVKKAKSGNNKLIKEKEEDILLIGARIGIQRFRLKPIYEYLMKIKQNKGTRLTASQLNELNKEVHNSFQEYILQLKKIIPSIKDEEILTLCLNELEFSSPVAGRILHISDVTFRQRISRLRKKM